MVVNRFIQKLLVIGVCVAVSQLTRAEETPSDDEMNRFVSMPDAYLKAQREEEKKVLAQRGDEVAEPGYVPGYRENAGLGLSPMAPAFATTGAGAASPSFGSRVPTRQRPTFEFHGYLQPVLRMGAGDEDGTTTLHADPVVPGGAYGWFDHTNTVPTPWAQVNFSYGNKVVRAHAMLGAWSATEADEAAANFMGNAQQLFTQAYLTYTPDSSPVQLQINAGVFQDRYGFMAKWHQGAYGTSFIADINGMGITSAVMLPFVGDFDVFIEAGFKGEFEKVPLDMPMLGSNEHARSEQGSTFAGHGHMAVNFARYFTPGIHLIYSFSADDRKDLPDDPTTEVNETQQRKDGTLMIVAGDLRVDMERFGYLYAGGSHVKGTHTNAMTDLVKVLNTGSGKDFNEAYWGYGSNGTGTLTLAGLQYGLSLGTLLRHPDEFWGVGPDLTVNVFSILGKSTSAAVNMDDRLMLKYGTELVYGFSKHAAGAFRFDHVIPDVDASEQSFQVLSPKLIFRSDWVARESLIVQYSYYNGGDDVEVHGDNRLVNTSSGDWDKHMVAVYGTFWW